MDEHKAAARTNLGPPEDEFSFEVFKRQLQDALGHLYDPAYVPAGMLGAILEGHSGPRGNEACRAALMRAIEALKPAAETPPCARSRQLYDVLSLRYLQGLTQEQTAERLNITPRHVRRQQQQAIALLARHLWREAGVLPPEEVAPAEEGAAAEGEGAPAAWRRQVQEELAALRKMAPDLVANVAEAAQSVITIANTLACKRGVVLKAAPLPLDLVAAIHPSALRQVLVAAMGQFLEHMGAGEIVLAAEQKGERIALTITGHPLPTAAPVEDDFAREILAAQGGNIALIREGERATWHLSLLALDQITVLVVDDNLDLVHFYQRYTAGTRYRIAHVAEGQRVWEAIEQTTPDILVLDVMLPDVDGWELLAQLRQHPLSRGIPIIVCSVVREKDLALALGASAYLAKPVRRQEFVRALEQALIGLE